MKRIVGLLLAALALCLLALETAHAGAKDGKQRWSFKKTGECKWNPPIVVPAAKDAKEPGKVVLKIEYKANELAEFIVIGDGDSDLDLYIIDSEGKIVAKDEDPPERGSDMCVCRWTPTKAEVYTIVITNLGKIENVVHAASN